MGRDAGAGNDVSGRGIQLSRAKGWRLPAGAVSVARPSRWGNPWVVGEPVEVRASGHMRGQGAGLYNRDDVRFYDSTIGPAVLTPELAVALYRVDLEETIKSVAVDVEWRDEGSTIGPAPDEVDVVVALAGLAGKDLACWCPLGAPCHRDVLLDLALDVADLAHRLGGAT